MFAYLDAASGSIVVSAVAAGAAGISVAARMGLRQARRRLRPGRGDAEGPSDAALPEA